MIEKMLVYLDKLILKISVRQIKSNLKTSLTLRRKKILNRIKRIRMLTMGLPNSL